MSKDVPQYRFTEKAYITGDKLIEAGECVYFTGRPAHYMDPVNEAAREMVNRFPPPTYTDPIAAISLMSPPQPEKT